MNVSCMMRLLWACMPFCPPSCAQRRLRSPLTLARCHAQEQCNLVPRLQANDLFTGLTCSIPCAGRRVDAQQPLHHHRLRRHQFEVRLNWSRLCVRAPATEGRQGNANGDETAMGLLFPYIYAWALIAAVIAWPCKALQDPNAQWVPYAKGFLQTAMTLQGL